QKGPVFRTQVLDRFRHDDATMVRSVLRDLVDSSLVYRTGQGQHSAYRAAPSQELPGRRAVDDDERLATFVWVAISRQEPGAFVALCRVSTMDADDVPRAITTLLVDAHIRRCARDSSLYECATNLVPYGEEAGWEAAVFDHYQAMVSA